MLSFAYTTFRGHHLAGSGGRVRQELLLLNSADVDCSCLTVLQAHDHHARCAYGLSQAHDVSAVPSPIANKRLNDGQGYLLILEVLRVLAVP
jgi:hypothetical protein